MQGAFLTVVWGLCEGGVGWEASLQKQEVKSAGVVG